MLEGTVDELASAVAQRERYARRQQDESDQLWARTATLESKLEEPEELQSKVKALEVELVACRGPPVGKKDAAVQTKDQHILISVQGWKDGQYVFLLSSTSDIQQQTQWDQGKKCGHGKTTEGKGFKQSRKDNVKDKENKEERRPKGARK